MTDKLSEDEITTFIAQCLQKFAKFSQWDLAEYFREAKKQHPEIAVNIDCLYDAIMAVK